jgi:hypothetical protein
MKVSDGVEEPAGNETIKVVADRGACDDIRNPSV